jgi:hypothetical protein
MRIDPLDGTTEDVNDDVTMPQLGTTQKSPANAKTAHAAPRCAGLQATMI